MDMGIKMKFIYLFDVDNTLTPPRTIIEEEFHGVFDKWLTSLPRDSEVYFATGSDMRKIRAQVPDDIISRLAGVFSCMANQLIIRDDLQYEHSFKAPEGLIEDLDLFLGVSNFKIRAGNHIEYRPGMVNFSVVGRNASTEQRQSYHEFDAKEGERQKIAAFLNEKYEGQLEVSIGGEISIDIVEPGRDKSQAIKWLRAKHAGEEIKIVYTGDQLQPGGNDFEVLKELADPDRAFHVGSYKETETLLIAEEDFHPLSISGNQKGETKQGN
tara:strand:+ start:15977 stop:16783 length:807 start_codon:yes stop_codon:yes gene_type:complete